MEGNRFSKIVAICLTALLLSFSVLGFGSAQVAHADVDLPPATPVGLTAVAGPSQMTLTWNANAESDLKGYKVYMNGTDISGTVTGTTYLISGLSNGTTYSFALSAVDNVDQESTLSNAVTATPLQYPALMITEVVPDSKKIDYTSGTPDAYEFVEIYNTSDAAIALKNYKVIYTTPAVYKWPITTDTIIPSHGTVVLWAKNTSNSTTNTATAAGFNTSYGTNLTSDQLIMVDALGGMANTSARTLSIAAPNDVPISTVSYGASDPVENRGINYMYPTDGSITLRKMSYVEEATPGTVFAAQLPPSPSDTTAPSAPAGLSGTAGTNSVVLSWNAAPEPDAAYYKVYMDGVLHQTLLGNHTGVTISSLQNGQSYLFEVTAVDTAGNESPKSNAVTAAPTIASLPKLLITELAPDTDNYWPAGATTSYDAYEFVEIFNTDAAPIDLQGYKLKFTSNDPSKSWEKAIDGPFVIQPRETKLFLTHFTGLDFYTADQFNHYYFDEYPEKYVPAGNLYAMNDVNGLINAGAQTIAILNPSDTEIVRASYNDNGGSDFAEKQTITYAYPIDGTTVMRKVGTKQPASPGVIQNGQVPPITKLDQVAPAAPTGVSATPGEGKVTVSWNVNAESDVTSYLIYKNGKLDVTLPATRTSLDVPLLQGDVTYTFQVSALDSSNNESPKSTTVSATPSHQHITQTVRADNPQAPAYQMLWDVSKPGPVVPGLVEDFVPQGMAYDKAHDWIITTSYMEDKRPSTLSVLDAKTGLLVKYVNLYDGSTPYNGHAGGVAVSKNHVWIASGSYLYQLKMEDLIQAPNKGSVSFESKFLTVANASFTTYADGVLWSGEYYYPPTYNTDGSHALLTRDNTYQYAWAAGYRLDDQTDVLPSGKMNGTSAVVPDLILSLPDKIQGMAVLGDSIMLSQSYSRSRDSDLLKYEKPDFTGTPHTLAAIGATEVPVWFLDNSAKAAGNNDLLVPPMLENTIERNGELYLLFESGANAYRDTANYVMDRMQKVDLTKWANYGKPSIPAPDGDTPQSTGGQTFGPQPTQEPANSVIVKADDLKPAQGKATVELPKAADTIVLPVDTVKLLQSNALEIVKDDVTITLSSDVLQDIASQAASADQKGESISLRVNIVGTDGKADLPTPAANAEVKAASLTVDFQLTITNGNGDPTVIRTFEKPVTVSFKILPNADKRLLGVYYISDDGKLEYVGGELHGDVVEAQLYHFSKYAVLAYAKTFADVPKEHWANSVIAELSAKHIVEGVTENTFAPSRSVTRAEFAALLARVLKLQAKQGAPFSDVPADAWYAGAVGALAETGIVNGLDDGTFSPEQSITREQMAAMLVRAVGASGTPVETQKLEQAFADDGTFSPWASQAVRKAVAIGLLQGKDQNRFDPHSEASRAETAQAVYNLLAVLKGK
ncbi:S-layer homology domain-containing protein [Paenibacillus whitsoniae]|nr:S-layer homology domain-containing protein [Paenibacillus whitsoniae]